MLFDGNSCAEEYVICTGLPGAKALACTGGPPCPPRHRFPQTVSEEPSAISLPKEMIMAKLDLYKLHKSDYVAPLKPVLVDIRPARYLSITGQGEPGGAKFQA